jgi:hypothetical protein
MNLLGAEFQGCLQQTAESAALQDALKSGAIPLNQIYESGEMPIVKWDEELESWLDDRAALISDMNKDGNYVFPWKVAKKLKAETLYFSQGNIGSCCGHAFGFAYNSSLLTNIALGGKQHYEPVNPIGTYVLSHGGRMKNGQTVSTMAKSQELNGNRTA